jgi:hypothetical protein
MHYWGEADYAAHPDPPDTARARAKVRSLGREGPEMGRHTWDPPACSVPARRLALPDPAGDPCPRPAMPLTSSPAVRRPSIQTGSASRRRSQSRGRRSIPHRCPGRRPARRDDPDGRAPRRCGAARPRRPTRDQRSRGGGPARGRVHGDRRLPRHDRRRDPERAMATTTQRI